MKLSDVAEQEDKKIEGRLYIAEVMSHKRERRISRDEKDEQRQES